MIAFAHDNVIAMPTKSNEWYTPARYVEAAREVMGSIDLDPASSREANLVVRATQYYSETTNGYDKEWYGNVWLNPPFTGTSLRETWTKRLVHDYRCGSINQAILLMPIGLDTQWFQPLWDYLLCFPDCRIYYYQDKVRKGNPNFASCFTYLGTNEQRFIDVFSEFGTVARRVSKPKEKPVTLSLWGDA